MESENLNQAQQFPSAPTSTNVGSLEQAPVQEVPPPPKTKKKINFWIISTIALLILSIVGALYFLKNGKIFPAPSLQSNPPGQTTQLSTQNTFASNQLVTASLILTYPDNWIPIFATPQEGQSLVYFATSQEEADDLNRCVSQGTCNNFRFKLEDFSNTAVWQGYSIENFIKQVKPEIQIDKLQKTTFNGRKAWKGYVDDKQLTYQLVIDSSYQQSKTFITIKATANENGKEMMNQYLAQLPSVVVTRLKNMQASDLTNKKAYILEISSSLSSHDYSLVSFILDSLLAPKNSTENYTYLLYTDTTNSTENTPGGPNYPKDNYLNNTYYLLTDNNQLQPGVYGTSQINIKLSNPSLDNFVSYLADPKYCQQDADCKYRSNFCTIGAYNSYHQFYSPWGCGPANYEGLGNGEELISSLSCQKEVKINYDRIQCINNSCQIINPQPICNP